jgi:hypothetical protein
MHCSGGHHLVKEEGGVTVDPRVATAAWGLFEVAEYHFLTLACYSAMIAMLTFFIWTNASAFLNLYGNTHFFCLLTVLFQTFGLRFTAILHSGKNSSSCKAGMIAN